MTTRVIDIVLEAGDHASLPAAGATPKGALYPCTTHGKVYRNDGAAWDDWATLGTAYDPELVRDTIAAALVEGSGIDITVDDGGDTITIANTGGGLDAEGVRDTIAAALVEGTGIDITVNDPGDTITIAASGGGGSTFHGVKVYRGSAYTIAHGAGTAMPWTAEEYDTDGYHDNATNNNRLTVPTGLAGKYLVSGNIGTDQIGAVTRWLVQIRKNGTIIRGGLSEGNCDANDFAMGGRTCTVDLAVGDYVDMLYYQQNGGSVGKNMDVAACAFSMHLLG